MRLKSLLLSSVAVLALTAQQASANQAPSAGPFHNWYLSLEASPVFAAPGVSTDEYDTPPPPALGQDRGGFGSIAFGHGIGSNADWRVTLAYTNFRENDASQGDASLASKLSFGTADFDVGFHRTTPDADFRFFGGLRALAENDSASIDKLGTETITGSYAGLGPRIGTDFDFRRGGPFGVSGGVAGAVLFGQRNSTLVGSSAPTSSQILLSAYNLEGNIALDYHPSPLATFSLGIRGAQWWNLRTGSGDPGLASDPNQFSWGPFVKLTLYEPSP